MDRAKYNLKEILSDKSSRKYDHDTLMPLSEDDIVIVGEGAGPSKLRKIQELKDKGKDIRMIYEKELCEIMNKINI